MEFNKINNLLGETNDKMPKFVTRKWVEAQHQSGDTYDMSRQIRFKTSMLRSDLCDYSDAYVWVKGKIIVTDPNNINFDKRLTLQNNAPFISCISKINGELVENAEDLDIVMPIFNLLEYSKNYQNTTGSLFNYYRDEPNEAALGAGNNAVIISIRNSKSSDHKTKIIGSLAAGSLEKDDIKIAIPLKYLGNFWRNLDIPLINSEITLNLSWYEQCVLVGRALRNEPDPQPDPLIPAIEAPTDAKLKVTDCKLYVPVVTLLAESDNKLIQQPKSGFISTVKWNKYMSQMSNQRTNYNLNFLIDPTFDNVNRLFVLSFENEGDRTSYYKYYPPKVEIKYYNVLIDGKAFFKATYKKFRRNIPKNYSNN